uniref:Helicase HerA central domain-containing protein n=1 Tax=Thermosporothrix sp. COM3 TaxID=2490863 RepID=A0A455SKR8_9CHLR|nr:hypothetical protein KTC_22430 [Thermosporothrix sp. COM3]
MIPGFDVESLNKLGKLIAGLERYNLEGASPEPFDPADLLEESEQAFFHIHGLGNFWKAPHEFIHRLVDLVVSAHHQRHTDLTFLLLGTQQQIALYLSLGSEKATRSALEGLFPGISFSPASPKDLLHRLRGHLRVQGVVTGIPSRRAFTPNHLKEDEQPHSPPERTPLERVIRGMDGATWAYIVQAHPRPRQKVIEERMRTIDLLTQITTRSRVQWSSTKQDSQQVTSVESGGQSKSFSGDMVNYRAQYLHKLLEHELARLDESSATGQWIVRTYFGASDQEDAQRLSSLLLGTLAGADSRPEPLRVSLCEKFGAPLESFHTFLSSQELATLIQLPREEFPGYALHDHVTFDVDFQAQTGVSLPLGMILQQQKKTHVTYDINIDALSKHAVVVGVTGSGKTTTVMNLLDHLTGARKPFLVIEPAKTEYRALKNAQADRADVRVFTLGNEMLAPFRLNPFEFETTDEPGSGSLMAHIDFLKAVFTAAFPMYAPLPQIIETAMYEIYEEKGWDITSSTNRRLSNWADRHRYPIFPTLADLDYKTQEVADRLRYNPEADAHIKASLKARIGSLRIGAKGLMLDTARSYPMRALLSLPTILELESIGNDEEKTFLMGLLLARIYEYRRLQASSGAENELTGRTLQHLIVIEEAHRLLQNTGPVMPTNPDSANPRAQAVEVFTNMLAEVRAYGQGILVAEQIPSKLAPDVLKNTNLKIVHRLIAQDDRQSIGHTMNLNEAQQTHLGVLPPGTAAVYAEGADHAYLVRMDNYKRQLEPLRDPALKQDSRSYARVSTYHAILDFDAYNIPRTSIGSPPPMLYQLAGKLFETTQKKGFWARLLLSILANPAETLNVLFQLEESIEAETSSLAPSLHDVLFRLLIVRGCFELLQQRGAQLGWTYPQTDELRRQLTSGLLALYRSQQLANEDPDEEGRQEIRRELDTAEQHLNRFLQAYLELTQRRRGPFRGCAICPAKCLYRRDVQTLLEPRDREWIGGELTAATYETEEERYQAAFTSAQTLVKGWLAGGNEEILPWVSYCTVLHTIEGSDLSGYERIVTADAFQRYISAQTAANTEEAEEQPEWPDSELALTNE